MKKSSLEKIIETAAESQAKAEWREFVNKGYENYFTRYLKIDGKSVFGGSSSENSKNAIFSYYLDEHKEDKNTNVMELYEERKQKIIQKKTEDLLNKVGSLEYLFNQQDM